MSTTGTSSAGGTRSHRRSTPPVNKSTHRSSAARACIRRNLWSTGFGFVGSDGREAVSAIQKTIREPKIAIAIANVTRAGNQVSAQIELPASAPGPKGAKAVLYVALADSKAESHVTRGENGGRNLVHLGVVRSLKQAATVDLDGTFAKDVAISVAPGIGSNGLRLVAFIQDPRTGRVLGVAVQKL